MTVVVAFLCSDGVVVAADSMLTPSIGNVAVGHHKGVKVYALQGPQLFAFAGDQGQAARFQLMADLNHAAIAGKPHALDFPLALAEGIFNQFKATGIANSIGVNTVLAFAHGGNAHCCVFEGALQPRLLDAQHYYVSLGSGKLGADPFLRFITDIFCQAGQPKIREALFLAAWTVQHVIDTNPGGVAGPMRIGLLEKSGPGGTFVARVLPDSEIEEPKQAIESAGEALRKWRERIESGEAADDVPPPPIPPPQPQP